MSAPGKCERNQALARLRRPDAARVSRRSPQVTPESARRHRDSSGDGAPQAGARPSGRARSKKIGERSAENRRGAVGERRTTTAKQRRTPTLYQSIRRV